MHRIETELQHVNAFDVAVMVLWRHSHGACEECRVQDRGIELLGRYVPVLGLLDLFLN